MSQAKLSFIKGLLFTKQCIQIAYFIIHILCDLHLPLPFWSFPFIHLTYLVYSMVEQAKGCNTVNWIWNKLEGWNWLITESSMSWIFAKIPTYIWEVQQIPSFLYTLWNEHIWWTYIGYRNWNHMNYILTAVWPGCKHKVKQSTI